MSQNLIASKSLVSGAMEFISTLTVSNTGVTKGQITSTVATGDAPMIVASTTVVSNLNSDLLDGQHGSYYNNIANLSIAGQATGDIIYYTGAAWTRLAIGNASDVLTVTAGIPSWVAAGAPGAHLLGGASHTADTLANLNSKISDDDAVGLAAVQTLTGTKTWDGANVKINDTDQLVLGDGSDDNITHNGTNTIWTHVTGNITIDNTNATGFTDMQLGTDTIATGFRVKNDTGTNVFQVLGNQNIYLGAGTGCNVTVALVDNASPALSIAQGVNDYLSIYTSNGTEGISLGNATTNPVLNQNGTGQVTFSGNVNATNGLDVTVADLTVGGANFAVGIDGIVDAGTWQATSIKTNYGGTGLTAYTAGDLVYYAAGTAFTKLPIGSPYYALTVNAGGTAPAWAALDPRGGGTGLTGYTTGDILYASSATALAKLGIAATDGALLMSTGTLPAWSNAPTATGDIIYWNNTSANWIVLPANTNGLFLRTNGAGSAPTWADPGAGYSWAADADAGGPKTLNDGETLIVAGGAGITTALSGASTPYTVTVNADVDGTSIVATGGSGAQLGVKADGINDTHIDWGTGANQVSGVDMPIADAGGYFPTDNVEAALQTAGAAIAAMASGVVWKGPVFTSNQLDDTLGIVQAQVINIIAQPTAAGTYDLLYTNDGTTTRSYGPTGSAASVTYAVGASINATIANIVAAINGDGSRVVNAEVVDMAGLDLASNDQLCLYGRIAGSVHKSWAANSGGGNWLTTQPVYFAVYTDENDDKTNLPNSIPGATDFSTPVAVGTLAQGWTYLGRANGSWWLWDDTDNQWTMIASPASSAYQEGNGIQIDTTTIPYTIKARLDANGAIEFNTTDMRVKLNGTSLSRLAAGLSIDLTNANTWSGLQTFSHASGISTDTITERTGAAGVTIDSLLIKDGYADRAKVVQDNLFLSAGALAVGDLVYITTTSTVDKANATSAATGFGSFLGVIKTVVGAGGSPAPVVENGFADVMLIAGLTIDEGDEVYVSKTAGSGTTDVSTFAAGNWIQMVGTIVDRLTYVNGGAAALVRVQIEPKEAGLIV